MLATGLYRIVFYVSYGALFKVRGNLTPLYRDDHFETNGLLPSGEGPICAELLIVCDIVRDVQWIFGQNRIVLSLERR